MDGYIDNNDIEADEPDWDSIREAEAILSGEIPSTPETRVQVRRWLGNRIPQNETTGGHQQ